MHERLNTNLLQMPKQIERGLFQSYIMIRTMQVSMTSIVLGGIQQLRGQEEGEGGSAKSPRLSTQGGVSLECPRGPKFEKIQLFQKVFHTIVHCNGW